MASKRLSGPGSELRLDVVEQALAFSQPGLTLHETESFIVAEGEYVVTDGPNEDGPIAKFQIRILFSKAYPRDEPLVVETAGEIERVADRHMYSDGGCCTCIWEEWLVTSVDTSVRAFCEGPLQNFFLGQVAYDRNGRWPFGERAHGAAGVVEAANAMLGLNTDQIGAVRYLKVLSAGRVKGHWTCPCGSNRRLRNCCANAIAELRKTFDRSMAERLHVRLTSLVRWERKNLLPARSKAR